MISKIFYLLFALDQIHVGSGETRLGVVDNFIVRDPSDGCPKIPGTSIHGCIRSNIATYAANNIDSDYLNCAGQIKKNEKHDPCPICWTFGRPGEDDGSGSSGNVSIYDAIVYFFPINTMYGLAYITTFQLLDMLKIKVKADNQIIQYNPLIKDTYKTTSDDYKVSNLGKMMIYDAKKCQLENMPLGIDPIVKEYLERNLYIIDEAKFVQLVNGNLDVRASISIEPESGIVDKKGPFVSESIPRWTMLGFDLIFEEDGFPIDFKGNELINPRWNNSIDMIKIGIKLIEIKGLGGRTTRGSGRLKCIGSIN